MKKTFLNILFGVLISFFFASCAIHQPMSEIVMFQQKRSHSDSTYFAKYSHSLASFNGDYLSESAVLDYIGSNYEDEDDLEYERSGSITTNFIFLSEEYQEFGLSIALAPLLYGSGLDLTFNVFEKFYMTAAGGMGYQEPQFQFIFQRRLLDGNPIGLSVGAVWRKNSRTIGYNNGSWIGGYSNFYTSSFGVRSVITLSPIRGYGEPRVFFYGTGSYNYDITLKAFYPKIGFSVGIY